MRPEKIALILGILLVSGALGFYYGAHRSGTALKTWVVRKYQVPSARAAEIRFSLNRLFVEENDKTSPLAGSAQTFGDGLLLVRAPEGYQDGIAQMISDLSLEPKPETHLIHTDYWIATGETGAKSNADKFGELSPVFSSIVKLDGERKFRILEHLGTNSENGRAVEIKGSVVEFKSTANVYEGLISLNLSIQSPLGYMATGTKIKPGEYMVVGENSLKPKDFQPHEDKHFSGQSDEKQTNIYHIVHVELAN